MSQDDPTRRVLVVEDEPSTRTMIANYLRGNGYEVIEAGTAAQYHRAVATGVDLVLLDIRLPDADGLELARDLRASSDVGLIFVTSLKDDVDRILGLEIGADDYITKPVNMRELLARVRSTFRRLSSGKATVETNVVQLGGWEIDLVRRECLDPSGALAPLTRAEFDMLAALVQAKGKPVSRDYLLDVISRRSLDVTDRTVDTLVSRLRRKIEPDPARPALILTERGVGYRAVLDD